MLGIVIILIISWLLLFFIEKKGLLILGFTPIWKRLLQFIVGFLFFGAINFLFIYLDSALKSGIWVANPKLDMNFIFQSLWFHIKSALYEDLIFRGALLYLLIRKLGSQKTLLISAVCFGIYHWFSYGIFGNGLVIMLVVLLITGAMGYVWAYSFDRTKSIMLGLGMHFGWNFVSTLFTNTSPYGELWYSITALNEFPNEWLNLVYHLSKGIFPAVLAYFFIRYFSKNQLA